MNAITDNRKYMIFKPLILGIFSYAIVVFSSSVIAEQINYTIKVPETVENGAVSPINISFSPPLKKGEIARISINDQLLAEITLLEGLLSDFGFRGIMSSDPSTVTVECANCNGSSAKTNVRVKPTIAAPTSSIPLKDIKFLGRTGELKFLLIYDLKQSSPPPGIFSVSSESFSASLKMTSLSTLAPYIGFSGSIAPGKYCYKYQNEFEKSGCFRF